MLRIGLAIYLTFVTLAGPLLCPCSFPRFFAPHTRSNADAPPAIPPRCPCCPGLPATSANLPTSDQHRAPDQAPCSCQTDGHRVVALLPQRVKQAGAAIPDLLVGLQLDVLFRWADFASLGAVGIPTVADATPSFLSPADRLHVLCLLRC